MVVVIMIGNDSLSVEVWNSVGAWGGGTGKLKMLERMVPTIQSRILAQNVFVSHS